MQNKDLETLKVFFKVTQLASGKIRLETTSIHSTYHCFILITMMHHLKVVFKSHWDNSGAIEPFHTVSQKQIVDNACHPHIH